MTKYYTQRLGASPREIQPLGQGFWYAYITALGEFARKNYFTETFADECSDGYDYSWLDKRVQSTLEATFGKFDWPVSRDESPEDQVILDLVEFFYSFASEPTESWFHSYCGNSHPNGYDLGKGRYSYTVKINELFQRFNQPFKLVKGKVTRANSAILDANLVLPDIDLPISDEHLKGLIGRALEHFYNRKSNHKLDGLRGLVDAYERLKTIKMPSNKKSSAEALVKALALEESMAPHLNALFRELTTISNQNTIRHHEYDKKIISDEATIEFLFYAYYNAIRFIISAL
ncbi:MAG: hypothetical protein Q8T09_00770 [Candidatus Melainabacteria bacterium]|nr:hypothetical protein [Candidatus Melainabacteria bacterium]